MGMCQHFHNRNAYKPEVEANADHERLAVLHCKFPQLPRLSVEDFNLLPSVEASSFPPSVQSINLFPFCLGRQKNGM